MMNLSIAVVAHGALEAGDINDLRHLFDHDYLHDFGSWGPDLPYGYAPHDFHVIARSEGVIVGHVGWARREISVGAEAVVIAGVGGVLVSRATRRHGLGSLLMERAAQSMREDDSTDFGYLGCREEVVPFYESCGWIRVRATERSIGRSGEPVIDAPGPPILILPIGSQMWLWPDGDIDLRGRAW